LKFSVLKSSHPQEEKDRKERERQRTKREELLFLRVLAFPKASRRGFDSRITLLIFSRSPEDLGEMEAT